MNVFKLFVIDSINIVKRLSCPEKNYMNGKYGDICINAVKQIGGENLKLFFIERAAPCLSQVLERRHQRSSRRSVACEKKVIW